MALRERRDYRLFLSIGGAGDNLIEATKKRSQLKRIRIIMSLSPCGTPPALARASVMRPGLGRGNLT
ncbi:hypothetical protein [Pseudomonas indica]|uniref:hypothetical protein n=1 Tax=Pseudomonas indica TaxID=137658 RepID=UPI0023F8C66E|nr:hypothetical protein [Pseudomonas indica]MBU3056572.1 hypothetical protein [Pseudomonas indica]